MEGRCLLTFLVSNWGVVMSFSGASAHGLLGLGAVEVMSNGDRVMKSPMRMGIASRMGRLSSLRLSAFMAASYIGSVFFSVQGVEVCGVLDRCFIS